MEETLQPPERNKIILREAQKKCLGYTLHKATPQ
jgi:hypothetical protein